MLQVQPLSPHSRVLLLKLSLQCQFARQQLLTFRHASTSNSSPTAKSSRRSQLQKLAAPTPQKPTLPQVVEPNPLINPFAKKPSNNDHTVRPLSRPLGLPTPPIPAENTGIDTRTWRQRRDDFVNYDKHLEKRKALTKQVATPYFREWTSLQYAKGKTFLAPSSLLRAQKALYFPNLHGQTLSSRSPVPTTPLLHGHISIIALFSGTWAERQTATFLSENQNPELHTLLAELNTITVSAPSGGEDTAPLASVDGKDVEAAAKAIPTPLVQRADINIEPNPLKSFLVRLFMPRLRKLKPPSEWNKWFLVTRGITAQMQEALGVGNSKVGYVYLVDSKCRVRWAGSGRAEEEERRSLVRGVGKLVEEWRGEREREKMGDSKGGKAVGRGPGIKEPREGDVDGMERRATAVA
ncbi:Mitochondrial ATPase complex subunit atp10 [Trapelia coarctata]|nr:Mitochondrial ATPase complex subunit atp10 [Trapelia coarctata]